MSLEDNEIRAFSEDLPENWASSPIGDLCQLHNGRAFKPTEWSDEGLPIVRIQNLNDPKRPYNYFPGSYDQRNYLKGGELLFAWSGTPGTSFGAHIWTGGEALLNQHIFRVDFDEHKLDKRFLRYAINQKLNDLIDVAHGGVGLRHVTKGKFEATPVALPPLAEQVRIADKLDVLLSRVSSGRERLERMQTLLKQFRQSVLSAAVSGELTREWRDGGDAEWDDLELRDCATDFSYGSSAKSDKVGAIPVVRMGNIQGGELEWDDLVFTSDLAEIEKYRLRNGDVLFNRTNSPELVGKTAIFRGQRDAIYAGYLIRVQTAPALMPDFLNYCLNSQYGRDYCWMVKTDGVSQSNINAQKLRDFPIALPSLPEQAEIVRRVESLFALADTLEQRYTQTLSAFETLTPALLAKAFRGELVPQDPNDEPASVLLERIRAAQTATAKKPKQPRKASGNTGAGGTGKRGRPRKNQAASQDSLFADVSQAKSVEEAIALLEAQKARKRLQMLQEVLEGATRQGRRLGMADLHRQYRSAFPDDDMSTFYATLKQLPSRLIAEAVQPDTLWETVSAD